MTRTTIDRRAFLALAGAGSLAFAAKGKKVPLGLELYSVRDRMKDDPQGTVRAVAKMGCEGVEFYGQYADWSNDTLEDMRKLCDDLNLEIFSTHNSAKMFAAENVDKAIEINKILGSKYIVMASAGKVEGLDGWKKVAETLTAANDKFKAAGMRAGFHNHKLEFMPIEGKKPIEVLAANTPKDVVLQLDVGTCVESGSDPVAWINQNKGRIRTIHLKEWSNDLAKGYKVAFAEGSAPWKAIFDAAEKNGGVEHYLIEQEGGAKSSLEMVQICYDNYRKLRAT